MCYILSIAQSHAVDKAVLGLPPNPGLGRHISVEDKNQEAAHTVSLWLLPILSGYKTVIGRRADKVEQDQVQVRLSKQPVDQVSRTCYDSMQGIGSKTGFDKAPSA